MAENSKIEWTDATWNPITGCTLVDEGCRRCYAAHMIATWPAVGNHPSRKGLARKNAAGEAKFTGEVRFNEGWIDQPLRWKKPRRIFVCAHGDLFHESVPDAWIDRVFAVMALCPQHTFQVLTKRPERAREYLTRRDFMGRWPAMDLAAIMAATGQWNTPALDLRNGWPLPNVWLGTSISDQASADLRIPHLLACPAAIRFVSAEPLLGPVILDDMCDGWKFYDALRGNWWHDSEPPVIERGKPKLDWVIVGGESGPGARAMNPQWPRDIRDQCIAAGVPLFFKQWGEFVPVTTDMPEDRVVCYEDGCGYLPCFEQEGFRAPLKTVDGQEMWRVGKARAGRLLDGRTWDQMPGVAG
jgi:protein gp37